ncbi:MAG TPA: HAMP domain-containing sensor histidine kinase [Chthoniobacteraceae bacterium]|nr:HAMP domain-containing sensor histidine kinase [Chthoniobacteraceae bacterium]
MTIRVKLTLWYVGVLFTSILICTGLLYREWVVEPQRLREQKREQRRLAREHDEENEHHENNRAAGDDEDDLGPNEMVEDFVENIYWVAIPATVLGLAGGWWLMRKSMAPVLALTKAAEQMSESNLDVRLQRSGSGDELDRLTAVFNDMSKRLADSFRRIREFTLRASHELKTPLTIMRGSMETALAETQLTAEQKERLQDEIEEVDRLAKIVDGLTLLTKADAGLIKLKQEHVRLDQLISEIYTDGQVLARPAQVTVALEHCEEAIVAGDSDRLRQMLLNLMDNAVKYNRPGGWVKLSLANSGKWAEITVENTGPGVPAELLPRLFDPFFRVDASHTREVDGCGLGLAIVQWIVTAHGGTVIMTSHVDSITTAKVRLPVSAAFVAGLKDDETKAPEKQSPQPPHPAAPAVTEKP